MYANKRFGEKRFDYEFFPDTRPGRTNYKSILLRNAGNDFYETFMRDAVIQNTVGNPMNIDFQAGRPCVVFINGEYSGLLNIRERSNEDNIFTNYDELEDIDMFENWTELKEGNKYSMDEIRNFVREEGHTFDEYNERIDIKEFIDVHLANFFYNNTDFPGNNIIAWKPQEEGGKWRLFLKDTDYGMGLKFGWGKGLPYNFEILNWLHNPDYNSDANSWGNSKNATAPFVHLENFPEVREDFINRTLVYMGDFLNSRTTIPNIDDWYMKIKSEWTYHAKLVGEKNGMNTESLRDNVEYMKEWMVNRDKFFPLHFAEFYDLGEMAYIEINQPDPRIKVNYEINGMPLVTNIFGGYYPKGKNIKVDASIDSINCSITGWKIEIVKDNRNSRNLNYMISEEDKNSNDEEAIEDANQNEELIFLRSDSFEFSCPDYASYVSIQPILDSSHLLSNISINVTGGDNFIPVEGIETKLLHDNSTEIGITDIDGKVIFEGKEWGEYIIEIADSSYLFYPYMSELSLNGDNSEFININLTERIIHPANIDFTIKKKENGLYDIDLSWEMEEYGFMDEFFGYIFHIKVNGEEIASTNFASYKLKDMAASNLEIEIFGETPYGKVTDVIRETIDISSFNDASIDKIEIENENKVDKKYYNLNGFEVNSENLIPGIYILMDPDGNSNKIIIR